MDWKVVGNSVLPMVPFRTKVGVFDRVNDRVDSRRVESNDWLDFIVEGTQYGFRDLVR